MTPPIRTRSRGIGLFALVLGFGSGLSACAQSDDPGAPPPAREQVAAADTKPGLREVFPHVRADVAMKIVEIDSRVPILVDDPAAPVVYLELVACIPDSKEHETLVVTEARPRDVHAALLLIGLQPGAPGKWVWQDDKLTGIPPTGDAVNVDLVYTDAAGVERVEAATSWVKNMRTGDTFPSGPWRFAGSRLVQREGREWYDADGTGVLIGLTTFGSETVAWPVMISPEAAVEEPVWIADPARVPALNTPVTVRITPVKPE